MAVRKPLDCTGVPLAGGKGKVTLTRPDRATDALLDHLREEAGFIDTAPPESLTLLEWADRFKITRWVASREIVQLMAAGKLKIGQKAVKDAKGRRVLTNAYWPA